MFKYKIKIAQRDSIDLNMLNVQLLFILRMKQTQKQQSEHSVMTWHCTFQSPTIIRVQFN